MILLLSSSISGMVLHLGYSLWLFLLKPFMWCRSDARLWHVCYFLLFISPLCGVAQTPDCGIVNLFAPFSRSHFRHSITTYYFYIAYSYITHMRASWIFCLSRDWRYDHRIFSELDYPWYIIPMFLMFASTFKRTHWLVPGYCLGQIFSCVEKSVMPTAPEPM